MRNTRNLFVALIVCVIALCQTSCLDSKPNNRYSDEAVIKSFYLSSKKDKALSSYKFVVDQSKKLIYNTDSIAYDIDIDSVAPNLSPAFISVTFNDSVIVSVSDSSFYTNFNNPVKITVFSSDYKKSASYTIIANKHQVDPDTFIWEGICSQIVPSAATCDKAIYFNNKLYYYAAVEGQVAVYSSENGRTWSRQECNLNGLADLTTIVTDGKSVYYVGEQGFYRSVDGVNFARNTAECDYQLERCAFILDGVLYGIATDGDQRYLVAYGERWDVVCALPFDFPVSGAAFFTSKAVSGKERAFVIGGIDKQGNYLASVYSTENGAYWSNLTAGKEPFTPRAYATAVQYGSMVHIFGGVDKDGEIASDKQLFSLDYGMTWQTPDVGKYAKIAISDLYVPRCSASAIVTEEGHLFLIGGSVNGTTISDVFKGINYASLPGFKK